MKKILLFLVLIVIILVGLYFAAPAFKQVGVIAEPIEAYESFVNDLLGKDSGEEIIEEQPVEEAAEEEVEEDPIDEEEIEEDLIEDEIIEEEPEQEEPSGPRPSLIDLSFYSDDRINFTYPSEFEVVEVSDLAFELTTGQGNLVATFDMFENRENLSISEFVKNDNIVDYVAEAERGAIKPETLAVAEEAIYLADFPGFITQDVYLVRIPGFIILIQARNQKDLVRQYVVPTLEAR
jgi:hypothetical protein